MLRLAVAGVIAALASVALVGCGTGGVGSTSDPAAGSSPSAASPTNSGTPAASPSAAPTKPPTATAAPNPGPPSPPNFAGPACTRDDVSTTYAATDNTAGHAHGILTWSNHAGVACSMNGYPQVWFDSPEAQSKLGSAAGQDPGVAPALVILQPDGLLHAAVTITEASFVDGCNVTQSIAMLVSPPLDHEASLDTDLQHVVIPSTDACSGHDIGLITVGPVTE